MVVGADSGRSLLTWLVVGQLADPRPAVFGGDAQDLQEARLDDEFIQIHLRPAVISRDRSE